MSKVSWNELFEAVREECSPTVWSRGVTLSRAGVTVGPSGGDGEVVVKLAMSGGLISPTITLWPDECDTMCDCNSADDPCQHVAAAVIALQQAEREGRVVTPPRIETAEVGYRLTRGEGGLFVDRVLVVDGEARPLETTVAALLTGRVEGPRVSASRADVAVEQALGTRLGGWLSRAAMARVLHGLARCGDVTLDGVPVRVDAQPLLPVAVLTDQGVGFELRLVPDPTITEVFPNGVALCGDTLRPVAEPELTGRELDELPRGRFYGPGEVEPLVARVLPGLRKRIPVDIRTRRLPRTVDVPPRPEIRVERRGDHLSVLPLIVYGDPPIARVDGERLVVLGGELPVRDVDAEERIARKMSNQWGLFPGRAVVAAGEEAVSLAARLRGDGRMVPAVRGEGLEAFTLAPPLVPRLEMGVDSGAGFELFFESVGDGEPRRADAASVLRAFRDGISLAPLDGGGFSPIPSDWLERFGHRVADLLAARDVGGELPRAALPDLARLCESLGVAPPPAFEELRSLVDGFQGIGEASLPGDLVATLRSYQRAGVDWLAFLRRSRLGGLLADDMGLGKTLQALCVVEGRTLVVAPTSVLHNWQSEARRFRPGLRCAVYHGPDRALDPAADITLTTYAILRLDADALAAVEWGTVVLDEAQTIKNPGSQVAQAAYRLRGGFRVALTGTPVENRLEELWSQIHFLNPGLLGSHSDFQERYARPISLGQAGAAARLRERTRPFLLRRLKREVARELPPRTDLVLTCELSEEERKVYDAVRVAARRDVMERLTGSGSVMAALEALLRLRQAACHSALVPGQQAETSSKLALLLETLDIAVGEGHKALVFSQWTSLLDKVEPLLGEAGIDFVRLDGSTRDRGAVVERFQAEDGPPVMLVSLKAGGTGLNLTAADNVFLLDPWWNPAVEDQAADRAHRIGQERPVFVHRLVAEGTVEERILELQERKRALADVALGGADRAGAITRDELLALLD